jgi:hypothetical protein
LSSSKTIKLAESLLHIFGCVALLYGVVVTVFVTAVLAETRPVGINPIQVGLSVGGGFAVAGSALLLISRALRKRFLD